MGLKVALITPEFYPNWGGVGTYCAELAEYLPDEVELHILTTEWESEQRPTFKSRVRDGRRNVHFLSSRKDNFSYNLFFQYAVRKRFPALDREHMFDLIHSNHAHMSDLLLSVRTDNPPIVRTIHTTIASQRDGSKASGSGISHLESSERFTLAFLPVLRLAERFCLQNTQGAIFVSEYIRRVFKKTFGYSIGIEEVIRNGVDTGKFRPTERDQARGEVSELSDISGPIVFYSGRLLALKGIFILLRAASLVLNNRPNVTFVFAGDGTSNMLESEISRLGLPRHQFILLGRVEHASMPRLYAAADVCVLPSLAESCPMSLLEAMASERAVVATSVGDIPEIVENGVSGMLISPNDVDALAMSIERLLDDGKLRHSISHKARETVEAEYSTRKMAARTFSVYERVMEACN